MRVEEQPACARRGTREAPPLRVAHARAGRTSRGGGRSFARGPGADRFGAGVGAVEAAGPHAGRPLARAWGGCRGQVRVGRLRLQQAGFLADSEKMADERPSWLPDGLVLLPLLQLHNISAMFGVVRIGLNCIDMYLFICRNDIETSSNLEIRIISPTM